ncbi:MAG: hypothetical protein RIQ41_180 [Candidatus Parcubacteria bacterium]|jgi:hypothetical protein
MAIVSKNHLAGGKYTGSHTTVIPTARIVCDIANACQDVQKISLGFIKTGLKSNGVQSVKIIDECENILLVVKGNTSAQEIRVYASNVHNAKLAIARGARNNNLRIGFRKDAE